MNPVETGRQSTRLKRASSWKAVPACDACSGGRPQTGHEAVLWALATVNCHAAVRAAISTLVLRCRRHTTTTTTNAINKFDRPMMELTHVHPPTTAAVGDRRRRGAGGRQRRTSTKNRSTRRTCGTPPTEREPNSRLRSGQQRRCRLNDELIRER